MFPSREWAIARTNRARRTWFRGSASKKVPELILGRTMRFLEKPELRLKWVTALVNHHGRRNEATKNSHAKMWRPRHNGTSFLRR